MAPRGTASEPTRSRPRLGRVDLVEALVALRVDELEAFDPDEFLEELGSQLDRRQRRRTSGEVGGSSAWAPQRRGASAGRRAPAVSRGAGPAVEIGVGPLDLVLAGVGIHLDRLEVRVGRIAPPPAAEPPAPPAHPPASPVADAVAGVVAPLARAADGAWRAARAAPGSEQAADVAAQARDVAAGAVDIARGAWSAAHATSQAITGVAAVLRSTAR